MEKQMLLDEEQYRHIWDWVDETLHFWPNIYCGHDFPLWKPFKIPVKHAVYGIEFMTEEQTAKMDVLIDQAFLNVTKEGQRIYSLNWQHDGFLYDPRKVRGHPRRPYFRDYYPNGDYVFFIDEHKQFGYLGHPWRQEVWIFGEALLQEFKPIYPHLGWNLLYEFDPA